MINTLRLTPILMICLGILSCNSRDIKYKNFVNVEGPFDFMSQMDLKDLGLKNFDAPIPFVYIGESHYWMYLSEGGADDGKHSHVVRVQTDLANIDKSSVEDVTFTGIPDAHVNEYNGWKAWLFNLYRIDSNEWLAFTHLEDQDQTEDGGAKEEFRIALNYSNDDAKSFKHLGFILKPEISTSIIKSGALKQPSNIAGGGLRWDDTYIYFYFVDCSKPDGSDRHGAVARAKLEDVIRNAREGKTTVWYKYYGGKWEEPGMGGRSADIGNSGNHSALMYNTYIKKWITFNSRPDNTITMRRTSDPLDFKTPDEFLCKLPKGNRSAYYSIVPINQSDMTTCGKEFYVYYRYWPVNGYKTGRIKVTL